MGVLKGNIVVKIMKNTDFSTNILKVVLKILIFIKQMKVEKYTHIDIRVAASK